VNGRSNVGGQLMARAWGAAGVPSGAGGHAVIDNVKPGYWFDMVSVSLVAPRNTDAFRVREDSMVGETGDSIPEGTAIMLEPALANGTIVTPLMKDGGALYLKPQNTRCPIGPLRSAKVIGVVANSPSGSADDGFFA